jgi:hypothetical protein
MAVRSCSQARRPSLSITLSPLCTDVDLSRVDVLLSRVGLIEDQIFVKRHQKEQDDKRNQARFHAALRFAAMRCVHPSLYAYSGAKRCAGQDAAQSLRWRLVAAYAR